MMTNTSKGHTSRTNYSGQAKMDTVDVKKIFVGTNIIIRKLFFNIQIMWGASIRGLTIIILY